MVDGSPLADLADGYFEEYCRLDPVYATLSGRAGFDDRLPDYSPDGWAARSALFRETLARLGRLPALSGREAVTGSVLRERLEAELAYLESGLASSLNIVVGPPMQIRTCLEQTVDPGALRARLRAVPAALAGYLRTVRQGRPPVRAQAEVVVGATRAWAHSSLFDDLAGGSPELRAAAAVAARGYAEFADALERDVLPVAHNEDGVGRERYAIAARHALGADPDLAEASGWLVGRLGELGDEIDAVAAEIALGLDVRTVCKQLDAEQRIEGREPLRNWMRERLDRSFVIAGRVLDVPEPLRRIDAVVPVLREAGPIRYLPPSVDLSRPGRVAWPRSEDSVPTWAQLTMIHHEGVPGHHLQVGAAVLDERLPLWQRHTTVYGHAEGWAVYAEGLMAELGALGEAPARLGYLLGLRANVAVALADIGVHTGGWSLERTCAHLREHTAIPDGMLFFTALRTAAWPGQALTYALGERAWRAARETARRRLGAAFDLRRFHQRMLGLGPCGLSVVAAAS